MQDTRFSNLLIATGRQVSAWLQNPWRRTSIQLLSIFGGFFLASAAATTAGQAALWDLPVAAVLVLLCEGICGFTYGRYGRTGGRQRLALGLSALNLLKIGFIFGMFVEALKLGS